MLVYVGEYIIVDGKSFRLHDIPDDPVAVGVPAKVIKIKEKQE